MISDPDTPWRKSSYSGGGNTQCVEVAPLWRKSTYSGGANTACVEVAPQDAFVGVRDTKDRAAGHLIVPRTAWRAFTHAASADTLGRAPSGHA